MGIIYRNGRVYSGGGSGGDAGVELTLAEYNALSEAEKMNGTVYYVKTGGTTQLAQHVGYDNSTSGLSANNVQDAVDEVKDEVDEALDVAKGKNRARVFATTESMNTWLSDKANAGVAIVGDNIYIVDLDVPDWWISEVLTEPDTDTGFYYKIAQLETQKVDLTTIEADITEIQSGLDAINNTISTLTNTVAGKQNSLKTWTYTFSNITLKAGTYVKLGTAPATIKPATVISIVPTLLSNVPAAVSFSLESDGGIYAFSSDASSGNSTITIKIIYI